MKLNNLGNLIFTFCSMIYLIGCVDSTVENIELENSKNELAVVANNNDETTNTVLSKIPIDPRGMEVGWQVIYEYEFDHYVARSEFGIWPTTYRQYAGSSGDPNRIAKLNELHQNGDLVILPPQLENYQILQQ